jgi:hypothetical protein
MKLASVFKPKSLLFVSLTLVRALGGIFILLLVSAELVSLVKWVLTSLCWRTLMA